VCTLAHAFEAAGLSTVVISSIRDTVERMRPPRALHAEFPLGNPLGKPRDPVFQHRVLEAAFALLEQPTGPVLVDFGESIQSKGGEPLACPLPPRYDPDLHPAVDEAQALRGAYDRAVSKNGRTSVGRAITSSEIPAALEKFVQIVNGCAWDEVGLSASPMQETTDIRTYYEELRLALAGGDSVAAWSAERWFYDKTEAGKLLLAAREKMKNAGAPFDIWFHMAPGSRQSAMQDLASHMESMAP
jgi:hypothetical protein